MSSDRINDHASSQHGITEDANLLTSVGAPATAGRRRRSIVVGMQAATETIKEKQARAKDAREKRRTLLDPPHKSILTTVADFLGLEAHIVQDFILDSADQIVLFQRFMMKEGSRSLLFFYQEAEIPSLEDCGRSFPGAAKGSKIMRVFISDAKVDSLTNICVYFLRTSAEAAVTLRSFTEDICFGVLNVKNSGSVLPTLNSSLENVFYPALQYITKWGKLTESPQGRKARGNFLDNLHQFLHFIQCAQGSLENVVDLKKCDAVDLKTVKTAHDCIASAAIPDVVMKLEVLVIYWCKQIEQMITII